MSRDPVHRHGISRVGVVVVILCIVILGAILYVALVPRRSMPKRYMDAAQIKQIHQSWLIHARPSDGVCRAPSMTGDREPDRSLDTTANLFSMCIMANFFPPELCIGPTEPSKKVRVKDDYNWEIYSPLDAVYWDETFVADLAVESNVSYAHMPLFGQNMNAYWRKAMGADFPVLGNRGPLGGVHDPDSVTCRIHGLSTAWIGNVCSVDNSVKVMNTFNPTGEDNIFAWDCGGPGPGEDAMITFTKAMTEDGPVIQHD